MDKRIIALGDRAESVDMTLERLYKRYFSSEKPSPRVLKYWLWLDVMKATGRYFDPPFSHFPRVRRRLMWEEDLDYEAAEDKDDPVNLFQYTIQLLDSKISGLNILPEETISEGDPVLVLRDARDRGIGLLGICRNKAGRERGWDRPYYSSPRGDFEIEVAAKEYRGSLECTKDGLVKVCPGFNGEEGIRKGDYVTVADIRNIFGQVHDNINDDTDDERNWRRGKFRPHHHAKPENLVYSTEPPEYELELVPKLLEPGKRHIVLDMVGRDVYLSTHVGIIRYPKSGVHKVTTAHPAADEGIVDKVKGAVLDFYLRKEVFQRFTAVRKMLIAEASAGRTDHEAVYSKLAQAGIDGEKMFEGWREVMDRVRR